VTDEVKLLSEPHNFAVVHLPGRKYPGVVVQGDTLRELIRNLQSSIDQEADQDLREEVLSVLQEALDWYVAVCTREGISAP